MRLERTLFLGVALATMACDNGLSGPIGDPMSRDEAVRLATGIVMVSEGAASDFAPGSGGLPSGLTLNQQDGTFSLSKQGSYPCPGGGGVEYNVTVDGSLNQQTESASFDVAGHQKHASCSFTHEGLTVTITGAPRLIFEAAGAVDGGEPSSPFRFSAEGALDWSASDGRSGRCPIEIEATAVPGTERPNITALICGHTFTDEEIENH